MVSCSPARSSTSRMNGSAGAAADETKACWWHSPHHNSWLAARAAFSSAPASRRSWSGTFEAGPYAVLNFAQGIVARPFVERPSPFSCPSIASPLTCNYQHSFKSTFAISVRPFRCRTNKLVISRVNLARRATGDGVEMSRPRKNRVRQDGRALQRPAAQTCGYQLRQGRVSSPRPCRPRTPTVRLPLRVQLSASTIACGNSERSAPVSSWAGTSRTSAPLSRITDRDKDEGAGGFRCALRACGSIAVSAAQPAPGCPSDRRPQARR